MVALGLNIRGDERNIRWHGQREDVIGAERRLKEGKKGENGI